MFPTFRCLRFACLSLVFGLGIPGLVAANPGSYFMAIHCDPQFADEQDWDALADLVAAADARGLKLTLQLNPLWAATLQAETDGDGSSVDRLGDLANWVANGHELGGHHHVFSHPGAWDGYSNQEGPSYHDDFIGDMDVWLVDLKAAIGDVAPVVTVSSKDFDFPSGVEFQTGGSLSTASPSDAAGTPRVVILNDQAVWNLPHGALIAGGVWQTTGMKAEFLAASAHEVFGVAFHPQDYYEGDRAEVDEWLDFLVEQDPDQSDSWTAGEILEEYRTSGISELPFAGVPLQWGIVAGLMGVGFLALNACSRSGPRSSRFVASREEEDWG